MAFYALEPWGVNGNNWQLATIGAAICNSSGAKPKVKAAAFISDSVKAKPKNKNPWQMLRDQLFTIAKGWNKGNRK